MSKHPIWCGLLPLSAFLGNLNPLLVNIFWIGFFRTKPPSSSTLYAHGRVNDPMAKLQFLRVGWVGVGWGWWHSLNLNTCWMLRNCVCLVIAHMLDASQLCLSCHCTHAGCFATVFVLSLHTCWMLRNCVCLVIAHMLDATQLCLSCQCTHAGFWMLRNCVCLVIAHMLDATQLCSFCHCTHAGFWMLRNCVRFVIAHMLDATQLRLSWYCTHAGCYATVFALSLPTCWMLRNCVRFVIAHMLDSGCYATVFALPTCWMLRNCVRFVIAHMLDATQLRLSWYCTHAGCYATVFVLWLHTCWMLRNCVCLVIACMLNERAAELSWSIGQIGPQSKQCQNMVKKRRLFSADGSNTYEFQARRLCEDTNPWKKLDEMNIWTSIP